MFSKTIICILVAFTAACVAVAADGYDLADFEHSVAKAYAEYERDVSQALALAKIRAKAETRPQGHPNISAALQTLIVCTVFLSVNAAQIVLSRFRRAMVPRNFSWFMIFAVFYMTTTVTSAQIEIDELEANTVNVTEVEIEIDELEAKFRAMWDRESNQTAEFELELHELNLELERIRLWEHQVFAWSSCVLIAQLTLGAYAALATARWFRRNWDGLVDTVHYLLLIFFFSASLWFVCLTMYVVFFQDSAAS